MKPLLKEPMKKRKDKLAEIARVFDLEIIYAFGSHRNEEWRLIRKTLSEL